ncbi:hypothetical protein AALB16_01640 [Lachnospiraceae bacterium 62-35]
MRKLVTAGIVSLAVLAASVPAWAAGPYKLMHGHGCGGHGYTHGSRADWDDCFVDENGDGVCDYFFDDDCDGVCDHCYYDWNEGSQASSGRRSGRGYHHHH